MRKILILFLIGMILLPLKTYAGIYGTLSGKVIDHEGKPVIGASVMVEGTTRGTYVKDKEGKFTIVNIPAGKYSVIVRAVGYAEYKAQVNISADQTSDLLIKVQPKDIALTGFTVVDTRMVDKTAIGTTKSVKTEDVMVAPVQSIQAAVGLEAGVQNSGGGYNIRGSRTTETQYRVDGLDVGNQFSGGFGSGGLAYFPMVSAFATDEVQVLTGGFSAEYGDALGGVVNTVIKTGRTDRYEGYLRWTTELEALYGSQSSGIAVERDGNQAQVVESGPGKQAVGNEENRIEFGVGGPLGILDGSTFYLSGNYMHENYRSASYEIIDPWNNNWSRMPNNQTWVKNLTGRLKFSIDNDLSMIVGGSYGMTNWENSATGWLYANDYGVLNETDTNFIPERVAKQNVGNQFVSNAMIRINHTLSNTTFYDFTLSWTQNSDESARRTSFDDPSFFSGFDLLIPEDKLTFTGKSIVDGPDKIVDSYQSLSETAPSTDGYLEKEILQRNPYTGYIETQFNYTGTHNPWGLTNAFVTHGSGGFSFRDGSYFQADGSLTSVVTDGDFKHNLKGGFEFRYYTMSLHSNGNPTSDDPFYDVYSDKWGGNIYAEDEEVRNKTSKPFNPVKFSVYGSDQIEFKRITFTFGLRMDYFNPNSDYRLPSIYFTPITADTGFAKVEPKIQISPRVNVTYPITDVSFVTITYGLFYKMPELQNLYDGFNKDFLRGNDLLGDPNLDAQRTNMYQIGYSNQLSDLFAFNVTAYYKDVFNQLGVKYVPTTPNAYYQYTIAEYGYAQGLEFSFTKNASPNDNVGFRLNYTLAQVMGTSTSSGDNYNPPTDPFSGELMLPLEPYPLGYDRTHNFVGMLNFIWFNDQGPSIGGIQPLENTTLNFTYSFATGSPYTRYEPGGKALSDINAERQPSRWNLSMRLSKRFYMRDFFGDGAGNSSVEFFLDIYNLVNRFEPVAVYSTSGDPDDDGTVLNKKAGDFGSIPYYKEANYGIAETYSVSQYDSFGNRLYSADGDRDKNGVVTQMEKYNNYMDYAEMILSYRGNYSFPRTASFGIMVAF